ncbi:unnamed protein product [Brassicogethes aeneus]|uniref:Protein kinase domain-containing protein n=1 Tax=Brassicogethes aeneus TaxID=1431903 RepID=A0A9P0B3M6_BRAAE|nr:unnamed protein product [Brassicogethes aeneus]
MGANQSGRMDKTLYGQEVNFDHFQILRAIGKGSFGKVCIVQKKDTKQMFAMKYMNKHQCLERDALKNVLKEVEILTKLEHPFLVNIWFSFQDEEDFFMVTDLLLGGDLRFHIHQEVHFSEESIKLMICELALALDYLQTKNIIHRDIKPDNILLDEEGNIKLFLGHFHLTDFNIATVLNDNELATSMSGTKPYIAPEIFDCAVDLCVGYSYAVDWWSLGVVAYEALARARPYDIHSTTSFQDVRILFQLGYEFPKKWSDGICDLLSKLLANSPGLRISSLQEVKQVKCLQKYDMDMVFQRMYTPAFVPAKDHLNCDPTFELEEMIVETKPLHKKKKRLAKQRSLREIQGSLSIDMANSPINVQTSIVPEFIVYNRYQEIEKREREEKEEAWENELELAMCSPNDQKKEEELPNSSQNSDTQKQKKSQFRKLSKCGILKINLMKSSEDIPEEPWEGCSTRIGYLSLPKSDNPVTQINEVKLQNIDYIDRTPSPVEQRL